MKLSKALSLSIEDKVRTLEELQARINKLEQDIRLILVELGGVPEDDIITNITRQEDGTFDIVHNPVRTTE